MDIWKKLNVVLNLPAAVCMQGMGFM